MRSVVKDMLKDAGLNGFFTNHSLRCTKASHLFQAGQNVKLIKEVTGHISNAVEKYETTSDEQKMKIGSIIQGENTSKMSGMSEKAREIDVETDGQNVVVLGGHDANAKHSVGYMIKEAFSAIGNRKAQITVHIDSIN